MSTHQDKPIALTVDQLRARLDEISASGHGDCPVLLPYDPGYATIGSRPTQPLTGLSVGFDWDHGKVHLDVPARVGVVDRELRSRADRLDNLMLRLLLDLQRLGSDQSVPLDQQVERIRQNAQAMYRRTNTQSQDTTP